MKSERQLNVILRESIKRISIEYLEGCEEFVQVFGKGFVQRKFEENVIDVYSNEENEDNSGYYRFEDKSITICSSGKDGKLLTPIEIEHDEDIKETSVHEAIHAILTRRTTTIKIIIHNIMSMVSGVYKSRESNITIGTGILEAKKGGSEIGRGLNEGLTEWICKIAGLKAGTYINLRRTVELLEIAIGSIKVMRLAKGNIEKNITKTLGMSKRECEFFLRLADQEYTLGRGKNFFTKVISKLEGEVDPKYLEKIKEDSKIQTFLESEEYKAAIEEKEGEIILEYARKQLEDIEYARRTNLLMMQSTIFDKYFKEEFEQVQSRQGMSYEQLQRFTEIAELMEEGIEEEEEKEYSSIRFQKTFKQMKDRYLTEFYQEAVREYHEGRLSSSRIREYYSKAMEIGIKVGDELLRILASKMNPEHSEAIVWLISDLCANGEIGDIYRYSIKKVKGKEGENTVFLKDGNLVSTMYFSEAEQVEKEDDIGGYFNFELKKGEDFSDLVNDFLRLKSDVEKFDPEAIIQILERVIMVKGKNINAVYIIEKGQIMPAENVKEIEFEIAEERNGVDLALRRPIDKIREYLFRKRQEAPGKRLETRRQKNEFKSQIRDMSNYDLSTAAKVNDKLSTKEIQEYTSNIREEEK